MFPGFAFRLVLLGFVIALLVALVHDLSVFDRLWDLATNTKTGLQDVAYHNAPSFATSQNDTRSALIDAPSNEHRNVTDAQQHTTSQQKNDHKIRNSESEESQEDSVDNDPFANLPTVPTEIPSPNPYASYYGEHCLEKYALKNLVMNRTIPSLLPEHEALPIELDELVIATWENITNRVRKRHPVKSYVLSHFLTRKQDDDHYHAVVYVQSLFLPDTHLHAPKFALTINYTESAFVNLPCELIPQNEVAKEYQLDQNIQAYTCSIPESLDLSLKNQQVNTLGATVRAVGHEGIVSLALREWDPSRGHVKPSRVYNYTMVTLVKTNHMRCFSDGKCDPPAMERLAELVAHHLLIGFDHIYIYCVDQWEEIQRILEPFIRMDRLTLIAANDRSSPPLTSQISAQVLVFSSHVERYRDYSIYSYIMDYDEFLYVSKDLRLSSDSNKSFPPWLDSPLAKYLYKVDFTESQRGAKFCAVSLSWFTLTPDEYSTNAIARANPNATWDATHSIILSYHSAIYRAPFPRTNVGSRKTITKTIYSNAYSHMHLTSFDEKSECSHRVVGNVQDALLVHYRIRDRDVDRKQNVTYEFQHHFMDDLYPGIHKLLTDLKVW